MQVIVGIVSVALGALFLSIPLLNTKVFRAVNIQEVIEEGRAGRESVETSLAQERHEEARDSARALIQRFRNDTSIVFTSDISSWDSVYALIRENDDNLSTDLLLSRIDPAIVDTFRTLEKAKEIGFRLKLNVVSALNSMVTNPRFFAELASEISLEKYRDVKGRLRALSDAGILRHQAQGEYDVKLPLSEQESRALRAFHLSILSDILYPQLLQKDPKKNRDWASEYIAQTSYMLIGNSYLVQHETERAIEIYDSLVALYPHTIYAEAVFLQVGNLLFENGEAMMREGKIGEGKETLRRAIRYLEQVEQNREIAREFPKYKHVSFEPNTYVNLDELSKAKRQVKEKTKIYTPDDADEDAAGVTDEQQGGNTLEDAVKLIGQCYVALGKTDSARAQLGLLQRFFPESDNLDDAQKAIADSYVRDGDMLLEEDSVSTEVREEAMEAYTQGVKQYLKFINVYPQSDLISKVYISLGDTYNKLGRNEESAEAFASALDRAKEMRDKAKIQLEIGNYYKRRNQYDKAIESYDIILRTFMGSGVAPNAQYLLGECYLAKGDTSVAMDAFTRVVSHYKESKFYAGAAHIVGTYYFDRGDYKDALEFYRDGFTYAPDDKLSPQLMFQAGMVWVKTAENKDEGEREADYKEAIKQFQKVVERYQGTAEGARVADQASFQLADCHMKMGQEEAAKKAIRDIQSRDIVVASIKIIGIDAENPDEELDYWRSLLADAVESEEKASILYDMAKIHFDKLNSPDSAEALYRRVMDLTEDETKKINAKVGIAFVHRSRGEYDQAAALLEELLGNRRVSPELRLQLRIQLYDVQFSAEKYETAYEGFEAFAAENPEHRLAARAHYRAGMVLDKQGKHRQALKKMELVIEKFPDSDVFSQAMLAKAEQLIALGEPRKGVEFLEDYLASTAIDSIPAAANIYLRIGETYFGELENPEKAKVAYREIVDKYEFEQIFSFAAFRLGTILNTQGNDEAAKEAFAKVKKEDVALYRAAQAEMAKIIAKTDPELAIENYRRIVEQAESAEDSALAIVGIGDVYKMVGKPEEAAKEFERVVSFYHGKDTMLLTGTIVKWIDVLLKDKDYSKSIDVARMMQEKYPDDQYAINAIYFEASALMAQKKYKAAREKFEKIISLDRSEQLTEIAYFQRGDCQFFLKRYDSAIKDYQNYLETYPKGNYRANALFMQGNAYWSKEQFKPARNKFQKIVDDYPGFQDMCSAKKSLAFCEDKVGNWRKAMRIYSELLKGSCPKDVKDFARKQQEMIKTQH